MNEVPLDLTLLNTGMLDRQINIQKHFEGNNDVVFFNISIDDNLESWKRMLISDKNLWVNMSLSKLVL